MRNNLIQVRKGIVKKKQTKVKKKCYLRCGRKGTPLIVCGA
jgi:hypothetical protein